MKLINRFIGWSAIATATFISIMFAVVLLGGGIKLSYIILSLSFTSFIFLLYFVYTYLTKLYLVLNGQGELNKPSKDPLLEILYRNQLEKSELEDFIIHESTTTAEFEMLQDEHPIVKALNKMRNDQDKYKEEETIRHWKSEGLAVLNDLLLTSEDDIEEIANTILNSLVKYVNANQGGLFIVNNTNEERPFMDMIASYAYGRKKFIEKHVEQGQGILGQVMREKSTIYMKDIPQGYVKITSGLGESTPSSILIVPLLVKDEFHGAIELASFELFTNHQIEFVEELAKNIASTIAGIKSNQKTQRLLADSQKLASELGSAEEEMSQNLEELRTIQEEMEKKQLELDALFDAIALTQIMIELDLNGNLIRANSRLSELLRCKTEDLDGHVYSFYSGSNVLQTVGDGRFESREVVMRDSHNEVLWLSANFSPVKNKQGEIIKILILAQDITDKKHREKEIEKLSMVADNTTNSVVITNRDKQIEYVNPGFKKLTGYTIEEVAGKILGDFLQGPETDQDTLLRIREALSKAQPIYEEVLNYKKSGEPYWISMAVNPVLDKNDEVYKFISIQADITETKQRALDYKYKLEAIDRANAVLEMDMNGIISSVNKKFLELLNYQKHELIGKNYTDLLVKGLNFSESQKTFWNKMHKGDFLADEFICQNKQKDQVWLRGFYNSVLDIHGKARKVIVYANDISEEKQLRLKSEAQQKELTSHLETINKTIATIEFDDKCQIRYVNNVFKDVSGYSEEELVGKHYDYILPESEISKPQNEMMWASIKSGNYFTGQFRQQSKAGDDLWLLGTFNPVITEDGQLKNIKMFAQFNTLDKKSHIKLSQMLTAYKEILPTVEIDLDGQFKKANGLFQEEFNVSRMGIRKLTIDNFLCDNNSNKGSTTIIQKLKDGEMVEEVLYKNINEADTRIYRALFYPINTHDEVLSSVMLLLIDKKLVINMSTTNE